MKLIKITGVIVASLLMASCYKFDDIPKTLELDSEYAVPIFDTTLLVGDFLTLQADPNAVIPAGTLVLSNECAYSLYFKNFFDNNHTIDWFEPKLIVKDSLPQGTEVFVSIYIKNSDGTPFFFWLNSNTKIKTPGPTTVPQTPARIGKSTIDKMMQADKVYVVFGIKMSQSVVWSDVKNYTLNAKLGMKAKIRATINR